MVKSLSPLHLSVPIDVKMLYKHSECSVLIDDTLTGVSPDDLLSAEAFSVVPFEKRRALTKGARLVSSSAELTFEFCQTYVMLNH